MKGMQALNHIEYMKSHNLTRAMLEGLPHRLPGIKPSCLTRLRLDGIIARKSKNNDGITVWDHGVYFHVIMKAWYEDGKL